MISVYEIMIIVTLSFLCNKINVPQTDKRFSLLTLTNTAKNIISIVKWENQTGLLSKTHSDKYLSDI